MSIWSRQIKGADKADEFKLKISLRSLKDENVNGLDEIISSLRSISDFQVYEELKKAYDSREYFYQLNNPLDYENMPSNNIYSIAHENLKLNILDIGVIQFEFVRLMYKIFEFRYFMTIQRNFDDKDIQNIYLSGLDERLIYALYRFDQITNWPQPTAEFFQKLQKVKWENKNTKKFALNLKKLKMSLIYTRFSLIKYHHLNSIENMFIKLMAGCSAVNDNRNFITKEDIVIGYKTYIKLLNTDITKYKARTTMNNGNIDKGYLVCEKCNEYYQLQPGESAEDFTDECECGGKLKYYKDINWLIK